VTWTTDAYCTYPLTEEHILTVLSGCSCQHWSLSVICDSARWINESRATRDKGENIAELNNDFDEESVKYDEGWRHIAHSKTCCVSRIAET
jgi:hypothetical protein